MTSRDFCYWLQGLFELVDPKELTPAQTDLVKRHLAMVFAHEIDPSMGTPEKQAELRGIHEGADADTKKRLALLEQRARDIRGDIKITC